MDLSVEQNCPSCGASIVVQESDRFLQCPFCGGHNYRISQGLTRFLLPDKTSGHPSQKELFFVPYLRCKGTVFSCIGNQVEHKIVDMTHLAMTAPGLPRSLGLRPQALKLIPVDRETRGAFFRQTLTAAAIFEQATRASQIAQMTILAMTAHENPLYHRAYIGKTISMIYLPLSLQGAVLHDAVTGAALTLVASADDWQQKSIDFQNQWIPHFLSSLCPDCGDQLRGERDSLILSCHNCHSSWEETGGRFQKISWHRIVSRQRGAAYLPFWKIGVTIRGMMGDKIIDRFGDFLRLTNQPLVVQPDHDRMPLNFWIPAMKIRPQIFLNLAKNTTLTQKRFPVGEARMSSGLHPVTLPRTEAVQALKTVLAEAAVNKRDILPLLPDTVFQPQTTELVYLPFIDRGHDLVQEQTMLSIASSVLRLSRSL